MKIEIDKPVIPQFVAEWYEREGKRSSWWNWFYKWGRDERRSDLEIEAIGWMQDYNEEKFVDMFRFGYEVEQEPLYYAKIKGWEHVGTSSYYFGYDEDNDSLEVTYLESNYSFAFSLTKKHWNKLGINDTNADFEEVE